MVALVGCIFCPRRIPPGRRPQRASSWLWDPSLRFVLMPPRRHLLLWRGVEWRDLSRIHSQMTLIRCRGRLAALGLSCFPSLVVFICRGPCAFPIYQLTAVKLRPEITINSAPYSDVIVPRFAMSRDGPEGFSEIIKFSLACHLVFHQGTHHSGN